MRFYKPLKETISHKMAHRSLSYEGRIIGYISKPNQVTLSTLWASITENHIRHRIIWKSI